MPRIRRASALALLTASAFVAGALIAAPASADTVTIAPKSVLEVGDSLQGYTVDTAGRTYVVSESDQGVLVYAPGASGSTAPIRRIQGAATGLNVPTGLAVDPYGYLYVTNLGADTVTIYSSSANGNVAPTRVLAGVATTLTGPIGVSVGADRSIRVADTPVGLSSGRIVTFAPLIPKPVVRRAPTAVRALTVTGAKTAKKRLVTWSAPASPGTSPITGYQVVVKKKRAVLLSKSVGPAKHKVKLKSKKLAKGKLKVTVTARNAVGYGPATTVKFKVKPA